MNTPVRRQDVDLGQGAGMFDPNQQAMRSQQYLASEQLIEPFPAGQKHRRCTNTF